MTLNHITYLVTIKGLEGVYKCNSIEDAFGLIKKCMPCEANIKAMEEK